MYLQYRQFSADFLDIGNTGTSFRTDTEISRTTDLPRERTLQRWAPEATDMSLDDLALEESGTGSWDQFKANEQMYGVTSSFDMDMYTTAINKSHPLHTQREMEAKRLAKEIEGSAAANSHVAEERQQNISSAEAGDEEEKYSGVRRDYSLAKSGSGSYVPPSRRPLTNAPTVPGAPYDPAIISSQLAKPQPAHPAPDESTKSEDKPAGTDASVESVVTSAPASALKASPNTTEGHVRDTADAFKQFANTEKLRIRQAQEQKRTNARNEKNVRINDLKKFAENFKLKSRVPDDLVPILAKDHEKQQEIRRKAEEAAQVEEQRAKDTPPSASPSSASRPSSKEQAAIPQQPSRQKPLPNRSQFVPQLLPNMTPRQLQVFKSNAGRGIVPAQQLPQMHVPSGPAQVQEQQVPSTNTNGPNAGSRLSIMSAKAFEFRPAASTFMPSGASPSPQRSTTESVAPPTPATFFDDKEKSNLGKSTDEDLDQDCNVIVYLQTAGVAGLTDDQKKSLASVGGVPQPYRTPPTWNVPQDRINTLYEDAFGKIMVPEVTMMQHMAGQIPHAHQLPQHMQGHMSAQQARYFQQTGMPHAHAQGFDPRMQYSGAPGSLQSSPRFPNAQVTMGQMPQFMGMPQFAGQSMPYAGMSPNLAFRQPHVPGNANQMMMLPGQQHGSSMSTDRHESIQTNDSAVATMRGYQQQGQHFAPNMPQMMVQPGQPFANGQIPQQPYSPLPHNAQPHVQHMGQHPGQAGFPASPRPGPHVMHHTNSHQGFAPHQMGMYTALPGQGSPYAMNQRQMSAGHFPQMTPRQQQAVPTNQAQPSPSPATTGQNTGKNDEGK